MVFGFSCSGCTEDPRLSSIEGAARVHAPDVQCCQKWRHVGGCRCGPEDNDGRRRQSVPHKKTLGGFFYLLFTLDRSLPSPACKKFLLAPLPGLPSRSPECACLPVPCARACFPTGKICGGWRPAIRNHATTGTRS